MEPMIPYEHLAAALTQWRAERDGTSQRSQPALAPPVRAVQQDDSAITAEVFVEDIVDESAHETGDPPDFEDAE